MQKQQDADYVEQTQLFDTNIRSMFNVIKDLLKNQILILVNVGIACELAAVVGLSTFIQKIVYVQFHFAEGDASLIVGFIVIPGAAVGAFFGGYLVKRFNWNCQQILRFSSIMAFVSTIFVVVMLVGCGDGRNPSIKPVKNSSVSCLAGCHCTNVAYRPICTEGDGRMFYSPCHAGCFKHQLKDRQYTNCSCFADGLTQGVEGLCSRESCPLFPLFAVGLIVLTLLIYINNAPLFIVSLRVVNPQQHALALGVRQIMHRLIGRTPGALIFGLLIDTSCRVWKHSKETSARNCSEYDLDHMRYFIFAGAFALKLLCWVFIFIADKMYNLPQENATHEEDVVDVVINYGSATVLEDPLSSTPV